MATHFAGSERKQVVGLGAFAAFDMVQLLELQRMVFAEDLEQEAKLEDDLGGFHVRVGYETADLGKS